MYYCCSYSVCLLYPAEHGRLESIVCILSRGRTNKPKTYIITQADILWCVLLLYPISVRTYDRCVKYPGPRHTTSYNNSSPRMPRLSASRPWALPQPSELPPPPLPPSRPLTRPAVPSRCAQKRRLCRVDTTMAFSVPPVVARSREAARENRGAITLPAQQPHVQHAGQP